MGTLKKLFPEFRRARASLKSIQKSEKLPSAELTDFASSDIDRINQASKKYYEGKEDTSYWLNKPFSDEVWGPRYLWRFGLLLAALNLRPHHRVLDFGCGTGWTSLMLARMGTEVVGVDIAEKAISIADVSRAALPDPQKDRCSFQTFDGYTLPFAEKHFDFVVVFEALHHLPNPGHLLSELSRVLKSDGVLGFAEPGLGHAAAEHSMTEAGHGILEQDIDLDNLWESARKAGFQNFDLVVPPVEPGLFTLPYARLKWYLKGASWLCPADFTRYGIVSAPIGILRKT